VLTDRVREREQQLARLRAELGDLLELQNHPVSLPSPEVLRLIEEQAPRLFGHGPCGSWGLASNSFHSDGSLSAIRQQ
jgi:hypothetical protein